MPIAIDPHEPAINKGIKITGIGKKGSQDLEPSLITEILNDLKRDRVAPIPKAAFFAALIHKGVTAEEARLASALPSNTLTDLKRVVADLCSDAPAAIQEICLRILKGETLDTPTARELGDFLFANKPGDGARGLVASFLRVRYETADEYEGLLAAMNETLLPSFKTAIPHGAPVVQLAEPFDGLTRSYLITPLIADFIRRHGYRVVNLVGVSSGPKYGNNLLNLAEGLKGIFVKNNNELTEPTPDYGWYFDQKDLSSAIFRWVSLRRQIIKRPFLATLERFINPAQARIIVTSAFHPPYTEKMITVCERSGFPAAICMRNGQEGSLAFPLNRPVKILCSARQADGKYLREEITFDPGEIYAGDSAIDEKLEAPSLAENIHLIQQYKATGESGHELFDRRVKITQLGLGEALRWVERSLQI